jgi:hypothetical protein
MRGGRAKEAEGYISHLSGQRAFLSERAETATGLGRRVELWNLFGERAATTIGIQGARIQSARAQLVEIAAEGQNGAA